MVKQSTINSIMTLFACTSWPPDTHTHICCAPTSAACETTGSLFAVYLAAGMKTHVKKHKKKTTLKMFLSWGRFLLDSAISLRTTGLINIAPLLL